MKLAHRVRDKYIQRNFDRLTSFVSVLDGDSVSFKKARVAADVPNNTLFRDDADDKLKFKDDSGTVNALY